MHFEEYKLGESEVPENKREKVALDRIEGLLSVKDVIENYYSKEHRFHFNASIKGALLYASSLGLNVTKLQAQIVADLAFKSLTTSVTTDDTKYDY